MSHADRAKEQGLHPDQEHNRRIEASEAETAMQVGSERARRKNPDPREMQSKEFTDTVTDLDLDRDLPNDHPKQHNITEKLGAHASKSHALGNITRQEHEREKTMDNARRHLVQMGFRRQGGTGSRCTGRTRARMTGGHSDEKPMLTADLDDQLDEAFEIKKAKRSASIGGWLLSKIADVHVVNRSEGFKRDADSESKGTLSRVTGALLGR